MGEPLLPLPARLSILHLISCLPVSIRVRVFARTQQLIIPLPSVLQLSKGVFDSNKELCGLLTAMANGRFKGPGMEQCSVKCKDIIREWYKLFQALPAVTSPHLDRLPDVSDDLPVIPRKVVASPSRDVVVDLVSPGTARTTESERMTPSRLVLEACIRDCLKAALPNAGHRVPTRVLRRVERGFLRVYPSLNAGHADSVEGLTGTQIILVQGLVKDQLQQLDLSQLLMPPEIK
jgi:hypothetical protein